MTVLETLKSRLADAQIRVKETAERLQKTQAEFISAQQKFQQAQAENQAASQEFSAFSKVVEVESKREETIKTDSAAPTSTPNSRPIVQVQPLTIEAVDSLGMGDGVEIEQGSSKTQRVRQLITERAGITPAQLWEAVKDDIQRRAYLYSILARLKDREQVAVKRGRYYPRAPKTEGTLQVQ